MTAVVATAVTAVAAFPGGAQAAPSADHGANRAGSPTVTKPKTAAEATTALTKMGEQMEVVTEKYNAARITLAKRTHDAAVAHTELGHLQRQVHTLQGKVRKVAITAYQNGHLASFSSFVSSKSPQSFLDQLSTLDVIAQQQNSQLTGLTKAQRDARATAQRAADAERDARDTTVELAGQKKTIVGQLAALKQVKATLSADELQAWQQQRSQTDLAAVSRRAQQDDAQADQSERTTPQDEQAQDAPQSDQASSDPSQSQDPQDDSSAAPHAMSAAGGSKAAQIAVKAAQAELGKPYVWAAAGPASFDCSGLMLWAWQKAGVSLPHSSAGQYTLGTHVDESDLQPGDLVFYYQPIHHVAMYVGHGVVIQAPDSGVPVGYAPVNSMPYTGATRVG